MFDPISIITKAATYAGAAIAQNVADKYIAARLESISSHVVGRLGRKEDKQDLNAESIRVSNADKNPEVLQEAHRIFFSEPALRRTQLAAPVLNHSQILWVDDNPANNFHERELLLALGSHTDAALTTEKGIAALQTKVYDLVISDMSRGGVSDEGLRLLSEMRKHRFPQQVIFYIGSTDDRGTPPGAFGITHRPNELLHFVMDVLERQRV